MFFAGFLSLRAIFLDVANMLQGISLRVAVGAALATGVAGRLQQETGVEGPTKAVPCDAPVARAPVAFPEDMFIGGPGNFDMYSGYVNVTSEDYLFYWLFEAQEGTPEYAPLIVWSNGGPGCSAMEGATTENGPYVLFSSKGNWQSVPGKLSKNPYAWNRKAHVLYVDQPRYVGYSCGTGKYVTSSEEAGKDMVTFLQGWRALFPEHASRDIIIAAESYGGHYIPAWTGAILDHNAAATDTIPLVGLAIGNGIINNTVQNDQTFIEFAHREGIIPKNSSVTSEYKARSLVSETLGYEPNYYDYRLESVGCCGCSSYNYTSWAQWHASDAVTKALNVCGDAGAKAFNGCSAGCVNLPLFDFPDRFDYSGAVSRALSQGIPVTLYYGMQDTACNYVGGYAAASSFQWAGADEFAQAPLEDLPVGGSSKMQSGGGLTWIQVEGSGHMVPLNDGAAAFFAIDTLVSRDGRGAVEVEGVSSIV